MKGGLKKKERKLKMPNWCNNTITIEHKDSEKINEVVKSLTTKINDNTNESLFFSYCKPEPDYSKTKVKSTYPEITKKEYEEDIDKKWWDWRVQNWGTKWNIEALDEDRITVKDNTVIFDCETAWSPPLEALAELENKGFEIECDYYEGGCSFIGRYETNAEKKTWSLPETLAELKDMMKDNEVFKDLVESWGVDLDYEEMEREDD
jgi:hypothetical protein